MGDIGANGLTCSRKRYLLESHLTYMTGRYWDRPNPNLRLQINRKRFSGGLGYDQDDLEILN
jgi:hypothetical protein